MTLVEAWGTEPGTTTAWPTQFQELLLKAALLADERALAAWQKVRPEMEVARLDASAQAVVPHLRANLTALGVNDELLALFKGVHRYIWAQNQLLLGRMTPFLEALEEAGIPTLLLKGAGMVAGSRLDAGMRPMKDLDVLVPTRKTKAAVDVLLLGGLVPVLGVPSWFVTEYAPTFECGWGFETIEHGHSLRLDLHWHASYVSRQPDADDDFWDATREVDLRGVGTHALSVNQGRRSHVRWDRPDRHLVPGAASRGELLVDLRVKHPVSPAELGQSEDTRPLGLFVRNVGVSAR